MTNQKMTVQCSNCGQPYPANVTAIIDVGQNPQLKNLLLTGSLNSSQCPNCGAVNQIAVPLLYHDPTKELLIAMVPMSINADKSTQERIVGDLMNQLSKENFKGYMFNPKRALTVQGLIDQILQADGINPEDWRKEQERQSEHIQIIQAFLKAQTQKDFDQLLEQYDSQIDESFLETMSTMAQTLMASGRPDVAQQILMLENALTSLSTYGQEATQHNQEIVDQVAASIQELGANASREGFLDVALQYYGMPEHLHTLVTIARPAFDYQFFQLLASQIDALPDSANGKLIALRDHLQQITTSVDNQAKAIALSILQSAVNQTDPEAFLRQNIGAIDANFFSVLQANIHHATQQKNQELLNRFKEIERILADIQQGMQASADFLKQVIQSKDPETFLAENTEKIDDNLLTILTLNIDSALRNGDQGAAEHLQEIYQIIMDLLQENMAPEFKFIQDLLAAETDEEAMMLLEQGLNEFDDNLIEVMNSVGRLLESQGESESTERLARLIDAASGVFNP